MYFSQTKKCSKCLSVLPVDSFRRRSYNKAAYLTSWCKPCLKEGQVARSQKAATRHKQRRAVGLDRGKYLCIDAKKSDRKKGWKNDLTREWVDYLVTQPCAYCEDTKTQMTLDRLDNDKPHTLDNVVPACARCNQTRGSMPIGAWMYLVSGMKAALDAGAFGGWVGPRPHSKKR